MAIHKKFNNQDSKISDLSIIDHSQLSGTNNYGAHPISAIRKLPEKLQSLKEVDESLQTQINTIQDNTSTLQEQINNVETNAKQIRIEVDDAGDTVTFYNYENESSQFRTGNAPDNITLEISNDELTLKQVFVNEDNLTGLGTQASPINLKNLPDQETIISDNNEIYATAIKDTQGAITTNDIRTFENSTNSSISTIQNNIESINSELETQDNSIRELNSRVKGIGGYLNAHDFGSANPTQEELNQYALSEISGISSINEVFNQTKVKNLNDGNI